MKNDSDESLMVCCADKIHNLQSMIDAYSDQGESLWDCFNSPKEKKLWIYEEILKCMKTRLDSHIVHELEETYKKAEGILLKNTEIDKNIS